MKESDKISYFELARQLENKYPKLSFRNHCYWRIALDNTLQDQWNKVIQRPAYKHLTDDQLANVISLLKSYLTDEQLLMKHNQKSLNWRGK